MKFGHRVINEKTANATNNLEIRIYSKIYLAAFQLENN